ncbi:MAG: hypothetical protein ACK4HW_11105 [Roseinatronobacter sp.]
MTDAIPRRDEVEDILFSVRKLVTQEQGRKAPAPQPPAVSLPGKLVLTAELRVPTDPVPTDQVPAPVAFVPASVEQPPAGGTPAAGTPAAGTPVAKPLDSDPATEKNHGDARASARSLLQRIAQQAEVTEPEPMIVQRRDSLHVSDLAQPSETDQPEDTAKDDTDIELALARLEAMLAGQTPPAAPETQPQAVPEPAAIPETAGIPEDSVEIDEAALTQLVAHIVRRELQGELGEKITRAIRKLVRAEVARELALRKV